MSRVTQERVEAKSHEETKIKGQNGIINAHVKDHCLDKELACATFVGCISQARASFHPCLTPVFPQ